MEITKKNQSINQSITHRSPEGKVRIFKTCVRPVITYGAESRADTTLTKQRLRTTEVRIIRTIHGKTIRVKIRSEDLRQQSKIQDLAGCLSTVCRKSFVTTVHKEQEAEEDQNKKDDINLLSPANL